MIFLTLFYTFFLIGLFTFGGGYAMIPMIIEQVTAKGWMTVNELQNFIAVSEMTPGPFAINIATFIGSKVAGIFGSICATLGVVLPSLIIIIIVAIILNKFLKSKYVSAALYGVKPIVMALILSTAITFFLKLQENQKLTVNVLADTQTYGNLINDMLLARKSELGDFVNTPLSPKY